MKEMTTREVQLVCLDILKDVHEFCVKNNIRYSLSGGSLLGAIRHNGFIPWDDDADIQMPRPDYDRFIHTYRSENGYKVFSFEVDGPEKVRLRLARVCDMKRTFVDFGPKKSIDEEVGVGIDIEPCDGAPDNWNEAEKHLNELTRISRFHNCVRTKYVSWSDGLRYESPHEKLKFYLQKFLSYFLPRNIWLKRFVECQKKYAYEKSRYFMASIHYRMGEWQPKERMEKFELHSFEDTNLYIMSAFDDNLKSLYGEYMTIPPVGKQVTHSFEKFYWK